MLAKSFNFIRHLPCLQIHKTFTDVYHFPALIILKLTGRFSPSHNSQHDIRCSPQEVTQLLLSYKAIGAHLSEAKCIALNQVRPELIAVGNNDPYARIYDRRMLKLSALPRTDASTSSNSNGSKALFEYSLVDYEDLPLTMYTPGHLPARIAEYQKRMKTLSITFLSFSQEGDELLVNLGGEQLYLFDLAGGGRFKFDSFREMLKATEEEEERLKEPNGSKYIQYVF